MSYFRPEIEAATAYWLPRPPAAIRMNLNEAPWDWPPELKDEAARALREVEFHRYPGNEEELVREIASRWGLKPDRVLAGNGSNELLQAVFLAALGPGRTLLLPAPTFSVYRQMALVAGARIVEVALDQGITYRADDWVRRVREERPAVTLICTPNNPTGDCFPVEALPELVDAAPGLVVLDEAYAEFGGESARPLLATRENVVILRTFSKAWGAAGLRLGYLMAPPSITAHVRKVLLPFHLSAVTARLGRLALSHAAAFEDRIKKIIYERERLQNALRPLPGLTVYPSRANFFLVRVARRPAADLARALLGRGILLRDFSSTPGLEGCLRISVGTPAENDALIRALSEEMR